MANSDQCFLLLLVFLRYLGECAGMQCMYMVESVGFVVRMVCHVCVTSECGAVTAGKSTV